MIDYKERNVDVICEHGRWRNTCSKCHPKPKEFKTIAPEHLQNLIDARIKIEEKLKRLSKKRQRAYKLQLQQLIDLIQKHPIIKMAEEIYKF